MASLIPPRNYGTKRDGAFHHLKSSFSDRLPIYNQPSTTDLNNNVPPGGYSEGTLIYNRGTNAPYIRTNNGIGGAPLWEVLLIGGIGAPGTLQNAYDLSGGVDPQIQTSIVGAPVRIRATGGITPITALQLQDPSGNTIFDVRSDGASNGIIIGDGAVIGNDLAEIAIGAGNATGIDGAVTASIGGIAIGGAGTTTGVGAFVSNSTSGIAIGGADTALAGASTNGANAGVAIGGALTGTGAGASVTAEQAVAIGVGSVAGTIQSVAVGPLCQCTTGDLSLAIGTGSTVASGSSIAGGPGATVGTNSVSSLAFGSGAAVNNNSASSVAIGQANTTAPSAIAIGNLASAGAGTGSPVAQLGLTPSVFSNAGTFIDGAIPIPDNAAGMIEVNIAGQGAFYIPVLSINT